MFGEYATIEEANAQFARAKEEFKGTNVILAIFRDRNGTITFSGGSLSTFGAFVKQQALYVDARDAAVLIRAESALA